jgi:hypothetical protein
LNSIADINPGMSNNTRLCVYAMYKWKMSSEKMVQCPNVHFQFNFLIFASSSRVTSRHITHHKKA